jgi:hypothetical protein
MRGKRLLTLAVATFVLLNLAAGAAAADPGCDDAASGQGADIINQGADIINQGADIINQGADIINQGADAPADTPACDA